jgi:hypothetical protein
VLSGVEEAVFERLKNTEAYELIGEENIFRAHQVIGTSVDQALDAAAKWIDERQLLETAAPGKEGTEIEEA